MPCVCHLLPCATAVWESQSHLVSLVCAGAIFLPTPWGALPSASSAGAGWPGQSPVWWLCLAFGSGFTRAGLPWQQPQMDVSVRETSSHWEQPEAGGLEQRRGDVLLAHSPAGCSPRGRQSWQLLGFSQPQRESVGINSCLLAQPGAAGAPLGSVLATMLSPPGSRWSSKPSAAGWGGKQRPQV